MKCYRCKGSGRILTKPPVRSGYGGVTPNQRRNNRRGSELIDIEREVQYILIQAQILVRKPTGVV